MTILPLRAAALAATAALALAKPHPAAAQDASFTRVSDAGESRVDGVRDGEHEGVPVRFVDMTIRNTSGETTFPETIQKVWWQGRLNGRSEDARYRDLRRRGMYEYVTPGAVWQVTYIIPRRDDVLGVTISDPAQWTTAKRRLLTWDELRGGAPTTAGAADTPAAASEAGSGATPRPTPAAVVEQAKAAIEKVPEPVRQKLAPAASRLKDVLRARLPGFLR